jgi:hypothetical protein
MMVDDKNNKSSYDHYDDSCMIAMMKDYNDNNTTYDLIMLQ